MSEIDDKLQALKHDLSQLRDEIRVQMHLAKAEARDDWDELESKWNDFEQNFDKIEDAAEESAEKVGEALVALGGEIREGYRRIRDAL